MNLPGNYRKLIFSCAAFLCACLLGAALWHLGATPVHGQTATPAATNAPASAATNSPAATNAPSADAAASTNAPGGGASTNKSTVLKDTDEISLSFQGANIDMVTLWLAEKTGKHVIKHKEVNCQLTIVGDKKVTLREGVNLIYRALAAEGYTAIESAHDILIVPDTKEPKLSPEISEGSNTNVASGRQKLVKIFTLKNIQATELKDKIKPLLSSDKAGLDVDERGNRIIVTDYTDNVALIGRLIEDMDTQRPDEVRARVLPLKHVNASDVLREIKPLYDKLSGKSQRDMIELQADDRANTLMVMSSQANFDAIQKLVESLDTEDLQEKTMQSFPLKNADAADVAKQLQDLNTDPLSQRYPYYYYNNPNNRNIKQPIITADRRRNTVMVQATPAQMPGIAKMIATLDEPIADNTLAPKIYALKYVSAVDIEDVLNELFLKKQQSRSYYDFLYDEIYGGGGGSSSGGNEDVGKLYGKVRITSEPYSNTLIVTANSQENLDAVEDILKQLDVPSQAGESTIRIPLHFAKAGNIANSINVLFARGGSPPLRPVNQQGQQQQPQPSQQTRQNDATKNSFELESETKEEGYYPWLGGQADTGGGRSSDGRNTTRVVSDLVGRVRAVPDLRANAVLISANVHLLPQITKLIGDLDEPTDQVLIEARLLEVSSDFLDKLGVRWSPDGSQQFTGDDFDNSILGHVTADYMKGFGGNTQINSPTSPTALAQTITTLRSGSLVTTFNMDFLIQFLKKTTGATVLAQPQINIRDNETGRLFVGQQVPIPDNTQISSVGGQNTAITYKNVGVILEVTPHINDTGDVELRVHAESSTVVSGQTVLGGAVFDTRAFRTDLRAKNGQTLVLGGIIQKQNSDTLRKTPYVGDVPGLGWIFKKKDKIANDVELMVFLRPRVVKNPEDNQKLLDDLDKSNPLIKKWWDENKPKPDKSDGTKDGASM